MKTKIEKDAKDQEKFVSIESLKALHPLQRHIIEGILSETTQPIDEAYLENYIREQYLTHTPLSPLTNEEEVVIQSCLVRELASASNRLKNLTSETYCDDKNIFGFGALVSGRHEAWSDYGSMRTICSHDSVERKEMVEKKGVWKLGPIEKIFVAFDVWVGPSKYKARLKKVVKREERSSMWGNRPLFGAGDRYFSKEYAHTLLAKVREQTRKIKINVLDIGGGVGLAMTQLKELDTEVETTNLTLEDEPIKTPVDHNFVCAAERMPETFHEQFDLILSNISFRYHSLPHISLRNSVLALAVGGEARLNVACDRVPYTPESQDYYARHAPNTRGENGKSHRVYGAEMMLAREYQRLKTLEARGYLRVTRGSSWKEEKQEIYGSGYYEIVKLKSISALDYLNA